MEESGRGCGAYQRPVHKSYISYTLKAKQNKTHTHLRVHEKKRGREVRILTTLFSILGDSLYIDV